ncbi:MAG: RNA polymerase sigma factor [Chitinophagaceae bacterium]|nr:RNA polymerase sigma factor [Chitinophagaceae bacterium]
MTDQKSLIKDCLRGKRASQKALYEQYSSAMLAVCYRYTKSMVDAEDVLQEGFVKVFNNLNQYKGEGELGAWIRRIMVNTAINYLKKNRNYQTDLSFDDMPLHPVSYNDPAVTLDTKQLADLIRQLPPGFQAIFNLHAVEGYTHVEIGEMLGINEGTSRSQYSRARALLVKWLNKYTTDIKMESYVR